MKTNIDVLNAGNLYSEKELYVAGSKLRFCINDKADLIKVSGSDSKI